MKLSASGLALGAVLVACTLSAAIMGSVASLLVGMNVVFVLGVIVAAHSPFLVLLGQASLRVRPLFSFGEPPIRREGDRVKGIYYPDRSAWVESEVTKTVDMSIDEWSKKYFIQGLLTALVASGLSIGLFSLVD